MRGGRRARGGGAWGGGGGALGARLGGWVGVVVVLEVVGMEMTGISCHRARSVIFEGVVLLALGQGGA